MEVTASDLGGPNALRHHHRRLLVSDTHRGIATLLPGTPLAYRAYRLFIIY